LLHASPKATTVDAWLIASVQSNAIVPCLFTHLADRQYKNRPAWMGFRKQKKRPSEGRFCASCKGATDKSPDQAVVHDYRIINAYGG